MTKDEALQMCLEYIETDAHERRYVRWAIKEALAKQEQGEPLPDFYITERTADSIYKLKSRDWALCISGNKGPTMHKNIPVFVGYIKTKPVEQEQGEPVTLDEYDAGIFSCAGGGDVAWWHDYIRAELGHAYEHYQSQMTPLTKQEQGEPVVGTKTWFEDGKVVTQNLYHSDVYTTPQQRKPLTDEQIMECAWGLFEDANSVPVRYFARAIEAAHKIKE